MNKKLRFFATLDGLWFLITICVVLYIGKLLGYQSLLIKNTAFARLLQHPYVVVTELFLACLLLYVVKFYPLKIKLISRISRLTTIVAIYHMFFYLIGIDIILFWSSQSLINGRIKKT